MDVAAEALYVASEGGDSELVQFLLGAGVDVNACVKQKDTTLIQTVSNGHSACVELLIKAGADVNMSTSRGRLALSEAVYSGNDHIVQMMINAGADVNLVVHRMAPLPLMIAAVVALFFPISLNFQKQR